LCYHYSAIFYALIGGYTVLLALWALFYHPPKRSTALTQDRPSIDFIGYALLAAALVPFLIALTWGGRLALDVSYEANR